MVVGADGIHSKVRELMFGPRTLGTYNQAVWLLLKRNIPPEVLDFSKEENQACWMLATKKRIRHWHRRVSHQSHRFRDVLRLQTLQRTEK